jgi:hypothetical protein
MEELVLSDLLLPFLTGKPAKYDPYSRGLLKVLRITSLDETVLVVFLGFELTSINHSHPFLSIPISKPSSPKLPRLNLSRVLAN